MGYNLHSACHLCKEKVTHLRGKEGVTIQAFYKRHISCIELSNHYLMTVNDYAPDKPSWLESDTYTDLTDQWWQEYFPELNTTNDL